MRAPSSTTLGLVSVGIGLTTAVSAALNAPVGVWIALLVLAGMCLVAAVLQHWREGRTGTDTLHKTLTTAKEVGDELLREARQPHNLATPWQVDNMMQRGSDWAEGISATLAEYGEHDRLYDWTRLETIWTAARPTRQDGADAKACIADRLWQRVEVVERYAREIANGDPPSRTDWQ